VHFPANPCAVKRPRSRPQTRSRPSIRRDFASLSEGQCHHLAAKPSQSLPTCRLPGPGAIALAHSLSDLSDMAPNTCQPQASLVPRTQRTSHTTSFTMTSTHLQYQTRLMPPISRPAMLRLPSRIAARATQAITTATTIAIACCAITASPSMTMDGMAGATGKRREMVCTCASCLHIRRRR